MTRLPVHRQRSEGRSRPARADEVTINMVCERLSEPDVADGFVLDGFPRTPLHAKALDKRLADQPRRGARASRMDTDLVGNEIVTRG
jgi:adenylate kinase family enzyme